MIQAAGTLADNLLQKWSKSEGEPDAQTEKIGDVMKCHYDDLREGLTVRQVKILKCLRDTVHEPRVLPIRREVYPELQMDVQEAKRFDNEFKYRLEYLTVLGLARHAGASEYALTNLGALFLQEAKTRKDYKPVLL